VVGISSLVLPICLSAVIVFLVSWVIHMFLPYHRSDFRKLPAEAEIQDALRKFALAPGEYLLPHGGGPEGMRNPEFLEKWKKGPVMIMTVMKGGTMSMGKNLLQWIIYCGIVSFLAAYVTGRALGHGAEYLKVFRFAGATAFIGYSAALWQDSIWHSRPWSTTIKNTFDGLIYGLMTAGTFGWLWPRP
jgi:hypothetical protein